MTAGRLASMLVLAGLVLSSRARAQVAADDSLRDLPLHVVPARGPGAPQTLALMLSGDGGWAAIDRRIADDLVANGIGVVGVDARAYLRRARTPAEAARDMARIIRAYATRWATRRVAIVGYSRGADMAPFVVNRLPGDLRPLVALIALLAPGERASFHFHWMDLLRETSSPSDAPVLPELERLRGTPVLCVYGRDEKESLCRLADTTAVRIDARAGRHHFDGDYDAIAAEINALLRPARAGAAR